MMTLPTALLLAFASLTAEFEYVDSNDDQRVSSSEHEVYARQLFDEMDADRDYKLTVAEIMADESKFTRHIFAGSNMLGPAELTTREKIQRIDANADGVISRDEHAKRRRGRSSRRWTSTTTAS
jgi:hypothetical protein